MKNYTRPKIFHAMNFNKSTQLNKPTSRFCRIGTNPFPIMLLHRHCLAGHCPPNLLAFPILLLLRAKLPLRQALNHRVHRMQQVTRGQTGIRRRVPLLQFLPVRPRNDPDNALILGIAHRPFDYLTELFPHRPIYRRFGRLVRLHLLR
jgi:hypothetical protein